MIEKKILNLCGCFGKQELYSQMVSSLADFPIEQIVYVPVRSSNELNKHSIDSKNVTLIYRQILGILDRLLYFRKISKLTKDVKSCINLCEVNLIHANFLFSEGGVALRIRKAHNIPYIVAVRNTDINIFFRYLFFYRRYGMKILENAEKIVLISPAYKSKLFGYIPRKLHEKIGKKVIVLPNGLNEFYHRNSGKPKSSSKNAVRLLYVGDFSKNKDVVNLIKLKQRYFPNFYLDIVGSGGEEEKFIKRHAFIDSMIMWHGRIKDKSRLKELYRRSDIFCMLSKKETFGMVYIEALSQGTPIIYTKNEGVDGLFDKSVGFPVTYRKSDEFIKAVELIMADYKLYSENAIEVVKYFDWKEIASRYYQIYSCYDRKDSF